MLTTAKSSVSVRSTRPARYLPSKSKKHAGKGERLCALKTQIETKITAAATRITTSRSTTGVLERLT